LGNRALVGFPDITYLILPNDGMLTKQFVDKPTHGQSVHGLDNPRTGQFVD